MKILITGGAGFIGANAALQFHQSGWVVKILDNLSRHGAEKNLNWLREHADFQLFKMDVRNSKDVDDTIRAQKPDVILHLAAQVAVTTSVTDPLDDFQINAMGTFNVLEAVRKYSRETFLINASTNKVYGGMEDAGVVERNGRYEYESLLEGVDENRGLDFHSPYGCSKGSADQYTIDYARIYGIRATSFRQSCIYGPRQFGIEDQGWVAWFAIASALGKPITIYGDGKQTRDLLNVGDLIEAYQAAIDRPEQASGQAFNIGGGPANVLSVLDVISILESFSHRKIPHGFEDWRPGDQRVYVSNVSKAENVLGWSPRTPVRSGVIDLTQWVDQNKGLFA